MNKHKILVAEDNSDVRNIIKRLLKETPYQIIEATDGAKTLEAIYNEQPSLILLDIVMPEKNGIDICLEIKNNEKTKDIPIIFITSNNEPEDIVKGFKAGGADYISKPFSKIELLARINCQMDKVILEAEKEKMMKEYFVTNHKKVLGEISMGISHNFNNYLTSVLLNCNLLQSSLKNKQNLNRINQISNWLTDISGMVNQFRYFTDSCDKTCFSINIKKFLSEKIKFLIGTNFKLISFNIKSDIPEELSLDIHESSFTQSIYQLLKNVDEFNSKENKQLEVHLSTTKLPENITKREIIGDHQNYLKIAFQDNGDKFDEEYFDIYEVFTPYYSTKNTVGVGMGLTIVRNFAQSHHGFTNAFNNKNDAGSTVEIYIPLPN